MLKYHTPFNIIVVSSSPWAGAPGYNKKCWMWKYDHNAFNITVLRNTLCCWTGAPVLCSMIKCWL